MWFFHFLTALLFTLHVGALPFEDNRLVNRDGPGHGGGGGVVGAVNDALDAGGSLTSAVITDSGLDSALNALPPAKQHTRRFGISYSPYGDDSACRTQEQVNHDMDKLKHYSFVRIYGVDCDQTKKVVNAARQRGLRVFAGVYDLQNFPASLDPIIQAAAGDWSTFHTISIGNELVNRGEASPAQIVNAVNTARTRLRAAGYHGPVVTVDTFNRLLDHPELCHVSDYCAANCHPFFDATQPAANAGVYVRDQARKISAAAGGKRTVITEAGWPKRGDANGKAVPSFGNHQRAIMALTHVYRDNPGDLVLFSAFNEKWKKDSPGTFHAEKWWGIESR
ncbi:hypothetical protein FE257_008795 [Aspergillus nanangensis]|uniref:Endo-1,3-beta-glucanase eglC n=1 Tax=Aspergillus nanangensis TaxID=2582783 RepID=A0AAD4CML7_ASPNN|nr:hypothetical protein FE257_008795 [Aspergillus nanangensis]